jgi:L-alanine-DL-glutamate epimerase-like enolase superfamily enzyme
MRVAEARLTRFQFPRDRVIGDSQVRIDQNCIAAIELIADTGEVGLGFTSGHLAPLPDLTELERVFFEEVWPGLEGQPPAGLVHRVNRPRGGNRRSYSLPFAEGVGVALWDLAAKEIGLPLHKMLGSRRDRVEAYASGLDYHLDDDTFAAFFAHARSLGFRAFKIKVGNPDFDWDLKRIRLLKQVVGPDALVMIDANEAWGAKEALNKLEIIRREGHDLLWVEDPILRDDFPGLKLLRDEVTWTLINSGEYLDASGKRLLLEAEGTDILNVHGQISDVMRIGWLAAEMNVPVCLGNTFLELGVHMACALPEVQWLEYSFQNYDLLVERTIDIRDGFAYAPDRPGHGLTLSEAARRDWARPKVLKPGELGPAPIAPRLAGMRVPSTTTV